jgi:hypothetical protein
MPEGMSLLVPIYDGDDQIGALLLGAKESAAPYGEEELIVLEDVADQVEALTQAAHALGCALPDPLMTMSFLALAVIPSLKLTDLGLVDVNRFDLVPLFGE